MKTKLVNKYDTYVRKKGTIAKGESMTDKSLVEETDIYQCIQKYGITNMIRQSMAKEPLYLDNTKKLTVQDAVNMRNEMNEYFAELPAIVRKKFGDSSEEFYQKYKAGEFGDMLETGIMTEDMINNIRLAGGENEIKFENNNSTNNSNTINNQDNMGNIQDIGGGVQQQQPTGNTENQG